VQEEKGAQPPGQGSFSKIAPLAALYFTQGLPFGFQVTALPVFLRTQGVSLTGISLASALSLPWMLKGLWAPLVDRWGSRRWGRRSSWIFPASFGLAGCGLAAAWVVPHDGIVPLLAVLLLMNLCAATQDIAVDGLAVDTLEPHQLGWGNAVQVIGFKVGMLTGGGLLVWASSWIGWAGLFLAIAILSLSGVAALLLFPEPRGRQARPSPSIPLPEILRQAWQWLTTAHTRWLLLAAATYKLGETMVDTMFKPYLVDGGYQPATIGLWLGTYGMAFSIAGSFAGGWLASRIALPRALAITAAARVVPLVALWLLVLVGPSAATVVAVTCAEHFFGGALTTAMFAFMMSRVDRTLGATHFTLLATVEVLGKSPGALLAGPMAEHWSYSTVFLVGVAWSILFMAFLIPLQRPPRAAMSRQS
jgi:predicted MFS family arabinose efflux permease